MNVRMSLKAQFSSTSAAQEARRIADAFTSRRRTSAWEIASLAGEEENLARVCRVAPDRILHVVGDTMLAEQLRELYRSGTVEGWSLQPTVASRTLLEDVRQRLAVGGAGRNLWCEKLLRLGFVHAEEVTACPDEALLDLVGLGQRALADLRAALPYAPPNPAAEGLHRTPIVTGNAAFDGADTRGWLIGHFAPLHSGRHADEVEIKWAHHPAGAARDAWSPPADVRTLTVLVAGGPFRVDVAEDVVELRQLGDYVLFGPGLPHRWEALDAATMLTVRWPAVPG
ncbi:hypothetical protein [Amycolatopsis sp. NPDC051903]|uniref:hypothetical protein n=1 Tax=Amycolatopsis sp. NPDC051903 TaxID=3363936 RepID=UPI0037B6F950